MRLKGMEGPLAVHNGNPDILNSPKRLNTIQNSNLTTNNYQLNNTTTNTTTITRNLTNNDVITTDTTNEEIILNNINNSEVQWCTATTRELTNNANNRLFNINNTLAVSLRVNARHGTASSVCSESSPDDSLLDYEDAHQSCSSVDTSPQEEERDFDISDSESDEGNLNTLHRRGIVNPNYPGFQHLAHTLEYGIKTGSDSDEDDYDLTTTTKLAQDNNINNNNNNNEVVELVVDKIDSVNRLDSVENIQKVFYDKPVFNITCEDAANCDSDDVSVSNSNQPSDDDETPKILLNIKSDEAEYKQEIKESISCGNIIGDFGGEVEREFGRITRDHDFYEVLPRLEKAIERELEEAAEKLSIANDLEPAATKYNIQPNIEQPFNKAHVVEKQVLQDAKIVENMSEVKTYTYNDNLKTELDDFKENIKMKLSDAFLSSVQDNIEPSIFMKMEIDQQPPIQPMMEDEEEEEEEQQQQQQVQPDQQHNHLDEAKKTNDEFIRRDSNRELIEANENVRKCVEIENKSDEVEKFCKEDKTKDEKEKDEDSAVPRKKEKVEMGYVKKRRDYNQQMASLITIPKREISGRNGRDCMNRRSLPLPNSNTKKRTNPEALGGFDVYNIETAMPKIDLEAIESHLRAAREEERRRRTDREEIRRRLAMGNEDDYYSGCDRPGRKPSLQARLQSGMNLQICFMNETVSDTESPSSDSECTMGKPKQVKSSPKSEDKMAPARPATLSIGQQQPLSLPAAINTETDFFTKQARLQTEARMALAQAKEMARMQMEIERQRQKKSPITEMVRHSLEKVGIPFPEDRRRLSRQILTEMNVAQLQVIVNDLHTQIEILNENLVKFLMDRDDLHMEQDSMLVDIEDLTRFLGAKEQTLKDHSLPNLPNNNIQPPSPAPSSPLAALNSSVKPHLNRIASLVKK